MVERTGGAAVEPGSKALSPGPRSSGSVRVETKASGSPPHRLAAVLLTHPFWTVGIVAALARLVAVIALGPLQPGVAVPDEIQYIELAESVAAGRGAEAWFPGYGQSLYDTTATYMRPLAALTWLFGEHQILGQMLSSVFGVITALVTTVLARRVVRPPFALVAGLMVALLPSQIYWSSVVLRESMTWAAAAALALALARAKTASTPKAMAAWALFAFACVYALGDLRQLTAVLGAVTLVVAAALLPGPRRLTVTAGAVVIAFAAPLLTGLGPFGYTFVEEAVPRLAIIRANLSLGAESSIVDTTALLPSPSPTEVGRPSAGPDQPEQSSTATESPTSPPGDGSSPPTSAGDGGDNSAPPSDAVIVRTPSGQAFLVEEDQTAALSKFPAGLVAVTLRPFPWEPAANTGVFLAKLENVVWAALYCLAVVGAIACWRRRVWTLFPIGYVLAVVGAAAITQANLGTAFRHRGQIFWAVALLSAAGLQWIVDRRRTRSS